jgi:tRNA-specific 2-thiouridylase
MIMLRDGEDGFAAGQACVFYSDGTPEARVLGGGWIARTLKPLMVEGFENTADALPMESAAGHGVGSR